jgi:hypothetical protein
MYRLKLFILLTLLVVMSALTGGIDRVHAGPGAHAGTDASVTPSGGTFFGQ